MGFGLRKYVLNQVSNVIRAGGEPVTIEEKRKRLEACSKCPHKGKVTPLPTIKVDGCTLCGCVLDIKAGLKTVQRIQGHEGPITPEEILKIKAGAKTETIIVTCPDVEGRRWDL